MGVLVVAGLICIAIALVGVFLWRLVQPPKCLQNIPGPNMLKYYKEMVINKMPIVEGREKFPELKKCDYYRFFVLGNWGFFICDPEMARHVYTETDAFPKFLLYEVKPEAIIAKFMGINLVFSNGDVWKKHHKIISPAFQTKNLMKISHFTFEPMVEQVMEEWKKIDGNPIDIRDWMQRFTLDSLSRAAFSFDLGSVKDKDALHVKTYNAILKAISNPLYALAPIITTFKFIPAIRKTHEQIASFDKLLYSIIEKRRKEHQEHKRTDAVDLLDLMICSQEEGGERLSLNNQELRDNVVIFFLAGHDTTANALSLAFYMLGKHPEVQEKVRKEIQEVYKKSNSSTSETEWVPNYEDQKSFEYRTAVIKETMRLYPSVVILPGRTTSQSVKLSDTITLPPKTFVSVDIFQLQRNVRVWGADADEFKPERFLPDGSASTLHPMAFSPFGGGARSCIGQNFSMIEQRMFLATALLRYDIRLTPGFEKLKIRPGGALMQPDDLFVTCTRRF